MLNEQTGGAHVNNRQCGPYKLLSNVTAATAGGLPQILDTNLYTIGGVAAWLSPSLTRGAAPVQLLDAAGAGTGIWIYRPPQAVKVLPLSFLSDTGTSTNTAVYDIGLYPKLPDGGRYLFGKRHRATLTLKTLTNASMTVEPFTGTSLGGTKTLRHYDTIAWSYRDTGDLQVYDKGFDGAGGSGTVYVDMTGFDAIAIVLQTLPASSVRELVGVLEECS